MIKNGIVLDILCIIAGRKRVLCEGGSPYLGGRWGELDLVSGKVMTGHRKNRQRNTKMARN